MILRDGLLKGHRVALSGVTPGGVVEAELERLGAGLEVMPELGEAPEEEAVETWVSERQPLHGLVVDARAAFAGGDAEGVRRALELAWIPARAVATAALIPAGQGRLVFVAPASEAGPLAEAARAGLENLARTLSVEWARHAITAVALCPADDVETELATVVAYLLSPAGGYFTGARFDLAGPAGDFIAAS
jgi:NAD(P)-dependent dehydrogenase (short-subunit alcohol dehydrogenase family)